MPLTPTYAISKAAAFNLTQSLRALLAGAGVRVHAVLTGPTDTDMTGGTRRRGPPAGRQGTDHRAGSLRTGLFGSHSASAPITDYASTAGQTRHMIETAAGTQPGDPARAAAAILTALDAASPPLRLPLGDDAVDGILSHLDSTRADITTWEKLARDTQLPS